MTANLPSRICDSQLYHLFIGAYGTMAKDSSTLVIEIGNYTRRSDQTEPERQEYTDVLITLHTVRGTHMWWWHALHTCVVMASIL